MKKKEIEQEESIGNIEIEFDAVGNISLVQFWKHVIRTHRENVIFHQSKATTVAKAIDPKYQEVEDELRVTEALLKERQRVLDAIPECKSHGSNCVPHALKWIKEIQDQNTKLLEALRKLIDSKLFENIIHLNARAGGKQELADAWKNAIELIQTYEIK